jgi:hypothetical protein
MIGKILDRTNRCEDTLRAKCGLLRDAALYRDGIDVLRRVQRALPTKATTRPEILGRFH